MPQMSSKFKSWLLTPSNKDPVPKLRLRRNLWNAASILVPYLIYSGNFLTHTTNKMTSNPANSEAWNLLILLNSRDLRVVKVNFVGNLNHNSGILDLTNGLTLAVVDEVENVTDILVEVGVTENILAKEGVTLVVVDEGEADTLDNLIEEEVESKPLEPAPVHQNSSLFC